jgi:ankyrin repeat protein
MGFFHILRLMEKHNCSVTMNMDEIVFLLDIFSCKERLRDNAHVWYDALDAIANKTMHVDAAGTSRKVTLLHLACYHGEIHVVQQLLLLHANPSVETEGKCRPMHYAVAGLSRNALEICKLLPVADLAHMDKFGLMPLLYPLKWHTYRKIPHLVQWIIQQPQCDVMKEHARIMQYVRGHETFIRSMVDEEVAARKRWTAARAAWCVAVCVV